MIYKATEKIYCDSQNVEKILKKPTKKREKKWRVLEPGPKPGFGASCIECCVEIPTGKLVFISMIVIKYLIVIYDPI